MTTDAILEFRSDLSRYRDFFLKVSCPASPVDFSAHFTRGAVQVSGVPYVVLQNDASEVCIKHITRCVRPPPVRPLRLPVSVSGHTQQRKADIPSGLLASSQGEKAFFHPA